MGVRLRSKILILKTGDLPDRVTTRYGPYERLFTDTSNDGAEFSVVDARRDCPLDIDCAGVIVTGSASSVYDGDPWIGKAEDFLRRALDNDVPVYGICFGHQLLAQALGGRVEKCPHGWELGTSWIRLDPEARGDPLFAGVPLEFRAQQSHGDIVTELPTGAVRLAGNLHWRIQAARFNELAWGTQFHPEFTAGIAAGMVECLAPSLPRGAFPDLAPGEAPEARILSALGESSEAGRCLQNFMEMAMKAQCQRSR
jgi:GMP synthase (glutamine-hydrolysing)